MENGMKKKEKGKSCQKQTQSFHLPDQKDQIQPEENRALKCLISRGDTDTLVV